VLQPFTACAPREFDRGRKEQSLAASPPQAGAEGGKKAAGFFFMKLYSLTKKATVTDRQVQTSTCLREALTTRAFALYGRARLLGFIN
jgi:hypothetical protein